MLVEATTSVYGDGGSDDGRSTYLANLGSSGTACPALTGRLSYSLGNASGADSTGGTAVSRALVSVSKGQRLRVALCVELFFGSPASENTVLTMAWLPSAAVSVDPGS